MLLRFVLELFLASPYLHGIYGRQHSEASGICLTSIWRRPQAMYLYLWAPERMHTLLETNAAEQDKYYCDKNTAAIYIRVYNIIITIILSLS